MKILNMSVGQDTGGQQMRLQDAWPLYYPDDEYISLTGTKTFYTIKNRFQPLLAKKLWAESDVIHVHNNPSYLRRYRTFQTQGKGVVISFHGTAYRTQPEVLLQKAKDFGAFPVCSTVDLWAIHPDQTEWIPQAYQLNELQSYRAPINDGIFRIAHAPTNRPIKSTNVLLAAVEKMQKEGLAVELDLIERRSNHECLIRKGKADVYVDQLMLGYGCNAVEAYGMGIPVIAGVDPERSPQVVRQRIPSDTRDRMLQLWGTLPFMEATEESLYDALVQMMNPLTRERYSEQGMSHFLRFHEALPATQRLRDVYCRTVQ